MDIKEAKELYDDSRQSILSIYERILSNKRFYKGETQWDAKDKQDRTSARRPCLTINQQPRFVKQVTNEHRKNKPQIKVIPCGYGGDKQTAKIYDGIIRKIRNQSNAKAAYNTSFHSAVAYGLGYFRIDVDYISNYSHDQTLFINRIRNEQQVTFNLNEINEFDFSDAENCFIEHIYTKRYFEKKNPKVETTSFHGDKSRKGDSEQISIMEHFEVINTPMKLYLVGFEENPSIQIPVFKDDMEDFMERAQGNAYVIKDRDSFKRHIKRTLYNGSDAFEEKDTIFKWIPIIPVIGEEFDIDGELDFHGMVEKTEDPQRQFNFWRTAAVENVALAGKPKWVGPEGFKGSNEDAWDKSNTSNDATLEYKIIKDAEGRPLPPPQYIQFNDIPMGAVQLSQAATEDFKLVTGIQDPSLGMDLPQHSGKAINELRQEGDTSTFDYVDNMTISMTHAGRIMVDAIPKVHNGVNEEIKMLEESGEDSTVTINRTTPDPDRDNSYLKLGGEYSLAIAIGPGTATRRQESQAAMRDWARHNPEDARLFLDLRAKVEDWDFSDDFAERAQALIAQEHPEFFQDTKKIQQGQIMAIMKENKVIKQQIQQLQQALEDKTQERQLKKYEIDMSMEEEKLKAGVKAQGEQVKQQGDLIEQQIKSQTDMAKSREKNLTDLRKAQITRKVDIS